RRPAACPLSSLPPSPSFHFPAMSPTELSTLSLHDALPISRPFADQSPRRRSPQLDPSVSDPVHRRSRDELSSLGGGARSGSGIPRLPGRVEADFRSERTERGGEEAWNGRNRVSSRRGCRDGAASFFLSGLPCNTFA